MSTSDEVATSSEPESVVAPAMKQLPPKGRGRGRGRGKGRGRQPPDDLNNPSSSVGQDHVSTSSEPPSSPEAARIRKAEAKWNTAKAKAGSKRTNTASGSEVRKKGKQTCPESFGGLQQNEDASRPTSLLSFLVEVCGRLSREELARLATVDISYAEFHAGMGTGSIALVTQFASNIVFHS